MAVVTLNDYSYEVAGNPLFEHATFGVQPQEKVAIVGVNGSGKSTLLAQISTCLTHPQPGIIPQKGLRISHLAQAITYEENHTILDFLLGSDTAISTAIKTYQLALIDYTQNPSSKTENALSAATSEMDHLNAWDFESTIQATLEPLGIRDLKQYMKDLSGGMQKKVALAQALIQDCDLLILDEPTNHLDIETIEWLETKLKSFPAAVLMVTHDRYFLDKVCSKIIEIDQKQVFVYEGNYTTYLVKRDARYQSQAKSQSKLQSVLRVELEWLKQGPKARSTKQNARKNRIAELMGQKMTADETLLQLEVDNRRLGKKILELVNVSKSFSEKPLIRHFSFRFAKGDKVGILGPNGAGKTTLLNLITGSAKPDKGTIDIGVNTVFGYFDQHTHTLKGNQTIYEHIADIGSHMQLKDGSTISASQLLERFLFTSDRLKQRIELLSGGEKRRLQLVTLLLQNPNFLLFDEPTNDFDIQTLSILEDFLSQFPGCLLVISHDRYFMDRSIDILLVFQKDGQIIPFYGTYSEYLDTQNAIKTELQKTKQPPKAKPTPSDFQLIQKQIRKLETEIIRLENEKTELDNQLSQPNLSADDYREKGGKLKDIVTRIEEKTSEWESKVEALDSL